LYGSRSWNPESHALAQGLGERLDVPQKWNEGAAPAWPVRAVAVGSKDCIANGDLIADGVPYAATFDGIIEACIIKQNPDDVLWTKVSDYQNCNVQRMYAFVILAMANDDGISVDRILRAFVGAGPVISFHKSDGVFNGVCTVTSATWQLVLFDGTRNAQQFALQAFNAIAGPQDFGGISTNPFWFDASTVAMAKMIADGQAAGMRLMIAGHSYGGAVACLVAARNRQADELRKVVYMTFGCPKIGDMRFVNVLQTCTGICISNDGDIVTILPPDAKTLAPINPLFPALDLTVWARWHRPVPQALLYPDGHFQPNAQVPTDTATMLALVADVIAQQSFDPVTQHFLVGYVGRLYARCPDCCFPNEDPVCHEIQIANPVLALTSAKRNPAGLIFRPGVTIPPLGTCLNPVLLSTGVLHTVFIPFGIWWIAFDVAALDWIADLTLPSWATSNSNTAFSHQAPCGSAEIADVDLAFDGTGVLNWSAGQAASGRIWIQFINAQSGGRDITVIAHT
jgi:pimeloyl-ACP methyl ester carboxylesterase